MEGTGQGSQPVSGGNPEHVGSYQDVQRLPRRNNWTISSDEALVDLLLEESKQPGVCSGSFRPEAWFRIWNEYQKRTREDTTLPQLKGRWKTLKKLYKLHSSLVGKSGWSWDFDTQRPTPGCPMVWEEIIKLNKEYKVCRDKPFPLFLKIHDLVASSTANGQYASHTGGSVRADDLVVNLDEGSGSSDSLVLHVDKDTIPSHSTGKKVSYNNASSMTKRKQLDHPNPSVSKKKSSDHTVEALNRLISLSDRRSKIMEQSKEEDDSFSFKTCMEKLSSMPGVSDVEE
ncbi:uncharacterized protein LOC120274972 isoform X3 [Dioscorea cayenensis subsp. rotundata]|uniref:Uncharacterized protein LOC120274972 isoform X3 n=1 Tax=Dioscorea cayennensis subsp. rotundata TaxID=55577 RepID=A0AB40CC45_DIOCR|nr:uncharacterized protein LOC120274972 isoform X3 [Dioscorea cayenensis subsp. rotundata]